MKKRPRAPFGRLVAPDDPAYDAAYEADYLAGQQQDGETEAAYRSIALLPQLPAAWERFLKAEELEDDVPLRRAIATALATGDKDARVVLTHQAGETKTTAA